VVAEEKGGRVVTRLTAGKMLGIEDGSRILSEIAIEFCPHPSPAPERLVHIRGKTGRFDALSHEVLLLGGVTVELADGEELMTSRIRYRLDERIARTESPVSFRMMGSSGTAVGLVARLAEDSLDLLKDVVLTSGGGDVPQQRLESETLSYQANTHRALLGGRVRMIGEWGHFLGRDLEVENPSSEKTVGVSRAPGLLILAGVSSQGLRLEAKQWTFRLDGARRLVEATAEGEAHLTPLEGRPFALEELKAEKISYSPARGGKTASLEARPRPHGRVQAWLNDGSLTQVSALTLKLGETAEPGPGGDRWALFEGDVEVQGADRWASATSLKVRTDHSMTLSGTKGRPARLYDEVHAVSAPQIDLGSDGTGKATGGVKIDVHLPHGAIDPAGGKSDSRRMAAMAEEARFTTDGTYLRLEKGVRTWQGGNSLQADWLQMEKKSNTVTAGGKVVASLTPGRERITPHQTTDRIQIRSATLRLMLEKPSKAIFQGGVEVLQGKVRVRSRKVTVLQEDGAPPSFIADGQVLFSDPEWNGDGDRLSYIASRGIYLLESVHGRASMENRETGSALRGQRLRLDPDGQAVVVLSPQGGRVSIRAGTIETPGKRP
ncbi:MAG: LptA/OstA family protein, partial [Acidobacteriota bacterium]